MKRVKPRTERERRVLAWCNKVRERLGRKPVGRFTPGHPCNANECVIARTIDGVVVFDGVVHSRELDCYFDIPAYTEAFIDSFDAGRLPHLID